jgi:polar amino acid transport system permease protein
MIDDFLNIIVGLPWTLALTVAAFAIGALLGLPLMMARRTRFLPIRLATIVLFSIVRAIPPIVWVFIIFFGLGSGLISVGPFAGCLAAFGLIAAVNMAEVYRGGLISIHHGQYEAAAALNLGRWPMFADVVAPQMFRVALPSSATYAIGLFKDTAIASTIGVRELTFQANYIYQLTFQGLQIFAILGAIYIVISLPIAWLSRRLDRYIRAKVAR